MAVKYKDYYQILGVSKTATDREIKSAFRKLARKYHPDVNPVGASSEQFKNINEAYEVLSDPDKRIRFDTLGNNWQSDRAGASGYESSAGGYPGGGAGLSMDDLLRGMGQNGGSGANMAGGTGFSDFFELLFGATGPGTQQGPSSHRPTRSTATKTDGPSGDLEQDLPLTVEELYSGGQRAINMRLSDGMQAQGTITIPKGISIGGKLRLSGQGLLNPNTGRRGNLILKVTLKNHPIYTDVNGANLTMVVQVPVYDLVLGCEYPIDTLSGKVTLTLKPGTQPGKLLRLKGCGLPTKDGTYGDLYVKPQALIPQTPSQSEQQVYQQLKSLGNKQT
jgi:curved DNA-binding protein